MLNEVQIGKNIDWVASQLTTVNSIANGSGLVLGGEPTCIGQLPGVVASSSTLSTDLIDVQHAGVFNLSVLGANAGGNTAITAGALVYFDPATGLLSLNATKVLFGFALGTGLSGATTVIPVKIKQ